MPALPPAPPFFFAPRRAVAGVAAVLFAAVLFLAGGCSYKIEIQQGDRFLADKIPDLQTGMTQDEVLQLLGRPNIPRLGKPGVWLYGYQLRQSGFVGNAEILVLQLRFDDDGELAEIITREDETIDGETDGVEIVEE